MGMSRSPARRQNTATMSARSKTTVPIPIVLSNTG